MLRIMQKRLSENFCMLIFMYSRINYAKQAIINLLHANSDVHSRILIAEFPKDKIKCIEKLQSLCANMNLADTIRHDRTFHQVIHRVG